ncbi:MAG: 16S rRNA (guanine(966)-N(2))-methyltransferase RsmD [Betaproteobacteria bacterium]|nr:16S rRNA (guanine(966)-N(2))-methyltransferase RsmD [Betaproteobacteria bacterium]
MTAARRIANEPKPGRPGARVNRLRIVGGLWRSRVVHFPDAEGLRPTPDRVRETLFNWLGQRLPGLACVDLFAGSGALGFEAKSRGAGRVVLVERDRKVFEQLRRSAQELGAGEGVEVVLADAITWLARPGGRYDIAFVDPPYASGLAAPALEALEHRLNPGARVYVEAPTALQAPSSRWTRLREGAAGAVKFALYEFAGQAGEPARQENEP